MLVPDRRRPQARMPMPYDRRRPTFRQTSRSGPQPTSGSTPAPAPERRAGGAERRSATVRRPRRSAGRAGTGRYRLPVPTGAIRSAATGPYTARRRSPRESTTVRAADATAVSPPVDGETAPSARIRVAARGAVDGDLVAGGRSRLGDRRRPSWAGRRPGAAAAGRARHAQRRRSARPRSRPPRCRASRDSRPSRRRGSASTWIDDGPIRDRRPARPPRRAQQPAADGRRTAETAPSRPAQVVRARTGRGRRARNGRTGARAAKYQERLTTAADALDRGRYDDARRMVQPVLRDLPDMAFGHEIAGLAFYRHRPVAQGRRRVGGRPPARPHAEPPCRAGRLLPGVEALRPGRPAVARTARRLARRRR